MKRCPECGSTYTDRIDFCFHEGAELIGAAVEEAETLAHDAEAGFDLPGLDLPPTPRDTTKRSEPTPVPLARMQLPPSVLDAPRSPLVAPPPPPRHTEPADPALEGSDSAEPQASATPQPPQRDQAPAAPLTESPATPVSSARSGPPPAPLDPLQAAPPPVARGKVLRETEPPDPSEPDHHSAGVPTWAWLAGGVVGVLLIGGAVLFALGGLGMLGAASARVAGKPDGRDGPPLTAGQAAAPADDAARFPEGDDERFPDEPLQVGVVALDSDTPDGGATAIDTDLGVDGSRTDGETGDLPAAGAEGGLAAGGTAEPDRAAPSAAPEPIPTPAVPVPRTPEAQPTSTPVADPPPQAEPPSPWGAMPPDGSTPGEAQADIPDAEAIAVSVTMDGGGQGLKLYVDGRLQPGSFPHELRLGAGTHYFKVVDASGKQYEIGKPIRRGASGGMSLQLFPP